MSANSCPGLEGPTPQSLLDLERYPVDAPDSPQRRRVIEEARRSLAEHGAAILPGFVTPQALQTMTQEIEKLAPLAYHEDVDAGTAYLALPDATFPEGHPRRTNIRSATWVLAYDLIPPGTSVRSLYEWDPLMRFVGEILQREPLYRFADPLGALNLTIMREGDCQGWHYDSTDFVVSLAIQASARGGRFECASRIRSEQDENYDAVAKVLQGSGGEQVEVFPMVPGTLMVFEGRHSLHRVSTVRGEIPRYVALLAYDTKPGTDGSALLKQVRYGRTEPISS